MSGIWGRVLAAVCLCVVGSACFAAEAAGELRPIPNKPENEQFKDAPEPWRAYLIKARAAERIDDPLQRCLAYPDLPGNQWPAGHAEAHCRFHAIQVISLEEIDGYLQRGKVSRLERRMNAYLAKHFSKKNFGEDIHFVFDQFGASEEADRISARWLELAPRSAYAQLARGEYYRSMAWKSRGGNWASETPRDNMRRMGEYVEQALPYLRKAADLKPRLLPAYEAMLDIGLFDSRPQLKQEAIQQAARLDPACQHMAKQRMRTMQPRWSGNYTEMLSFAAELSKYVASRPMLATEMAEPYGDRGRMLVGEKEYTREAADILDVAIRIGSAESHLNDAAQVALNLPRDEGGRDRWKVLSLLLQESRFKPVDAWASRQIAELLIRWEPEWSLRHSMRAVELVPESKRGHYLLAAAYNKTGQIDAAERHYILAAEDETRRRASLTELSIMLLASDPDPRIAVARSKPHLDRLLEEHPHDGRALLLLIDVQVELNDGKVDRELLRTFLRHADRADPLQAEAVREVEGWLNMTGSSIPASPP